MNRRRFPALYLLTALQLALVAPGTAAVKVQFSKGMNRAHKNAGISAKADRARIEKEFNEGLKELGKKNPAAKALFDSNQTIKIVCYGEPEAKGLKPGGGIYGTDAETIGDFDKKGNPKKNGTAVIVIDCGTVQGRKGFFTPAPDGFLPPLFGVLVHELLHATHKNRRHPPDKLGLYRKWEAAFKAAQEAVRKRQAEEKSKKPAPKFGSLIPTEPGGLYASVGAAGIHANMPDFGYFRLETGGMVLSAQALGFDTDVDTISGHAEIGYVLPDPLVGEKTWLTIGIGGFDSNALATGGSLDTDGADLGLVGPMGYGFVIADEVGGGNEVSNINFATHYETLGINLRAFTDLQVGDVTVTAFAGVSFDNVESGNSLAFNVGAFPDAFTRDDSIDGSRYGLSVGAYVSREIGVPGLVAYGGGHATVYYADFDGFSELDPGVAAPERAWFSESNIGLGAGVAVGLRYDLSSSVSFDLSCGCDYSDVAPAVTYSQRTAEQADIRYEDAQSYWAAFGVRWSF